MSSLPCPPPTSPPSQIKTPPLRDAPPPRAPLPTPASHLGAWLQSPPLWATLLVCAALLAARRPDALRNPQFWAEDGTQFFQMAWVHGWRTLWEPYASYLHLVPRLVAALAVQFDPRLSPTIFVGASFALTLYVAARTQSSRSPFGAHIGYALAVVLVPDLFEVLLFLANIQWVLAGGLVLLVISADAHRWWQHAHDTLAAVLISLTGPFSILVAPLFVWRACHRRTSTSLVLAGLVLVGAATQAWTIWKNPPGKSDAPIASEALLAVPGMRIAGSLLVGHRVPPDYPLPVETALGLLTLATVAALALHRGPSRLERLWLALAFFAVLAAALIRCRFVLLDLCHATFGSRYFFLPQLIVLWLLATLLHSPLRWISRSAAVLLLWMLAINLPRLRENGLADLHWSAQAAKLRAGEAATISINPAPWSFNVPAHKP